MAMAEPKLSMPSAQDDDLPRTFKRDRDARERQAREARAAPVAPSAMADIEGLAELARHVSPDDKVTVGAIDVPMRRLAMFFLKAVFAAIPALIVLFVILALMGQLAQTLFPWLIKMRIMITFPG